MSTRFAVLGDITSEDVNGHLTIGAGGAIALALRALGGDVTLRSRIGSDAEGTRVLSLLEEAGIRPDSIERIDEPTWTCTRDATGTILTERPGARMTRAGKVDVYALFGHDALVLDLADTGLRRFIIDLPAHTDATVKMISTLSFLDHAPHTAEDTEMMMRCDTIVGTERQYAKLTGTSGASAALASIFDMMPFHHLRAAIAISDNGLELVTRDSRIVRPVEGCVPDLLVAQTTAGMAWGLAHRADWEPTIAACVEPETIG